MLKEVSISYFIDWDRRIFITFTLPNNMEPYNTISDIELLSLINKGDRKAFAEVFDRYNKLLYSHVFNKLRDEESARDLVQEVFIALWEKREGIKHINLAGYLFTMGRNRVLNLVSHHKVASDYLANIQNYVQAGAELPDERIRERQLAAIIDMEIKALPEKMREVFILSRFEHLSNREIAEKLNISEHTVATHIKRSLKTLRQKIGVGLLVGFFYQYGNNPVIKSDCTARDHSDFVQNINRAPMGLEKM